MWASGKDSLQGSRGSAVGEHHCFSPGTRGKGKKKGWADSLSDVMSDFDSTRKDGQVTSKISFVCDLCGFTYHSNSFQRIFMNFCLG